MPYVRLIFVAVLAALPAFSFAEFESDDSFDESYVVTPARLKQSPHDAPASTSRIDANAIRDLQIRTIPELLRYVAGMVQGVASGNYSAISYHGTSLLKPKRMNVIVNGISEYRPSLSEVTWMAIPVSISDIDFVEVTRSPSAATYGSNSMMAVVKIQTKSPVGAHATALKATGGSSHTADANVQIAGGGDYKYLVSVSHDEDSGFDKNGKGRERHDDLNGTTLNARISGSNGDLDLDGFLGLRNVLAELEQRDAGQLTFPDEHSDVGQFSVDLNLHVNDKSDLSVLVYGHQLVQELEWTTCYPAFYFSENLRALNLSNPEYAKKLLAGGFPTGGAALDNVLRNATLAEYGGLGTEALSPICGLVNENGVERKFDVTVEDTYIFSDDFRAVAGIEVLRNYLDHQTFIGGKEAGNTYMGFASAELRFSDITVNLGGLVENSEGQQTAFSPRGALNYRIDDARTIRFVLSKALRTPDIMENVRDWNYYMTNMTPAYPDGSGRTSGYFYYNSSSESSLNSEEILAREISLYSKRVYPLSKGRAEEVFDIKFFHDSLTSLVSEKPQFFDFHLTNNGKVTLTGFELDGGVKFDSVFFKGAIDTVELHAAYAYIDNDTNMENEQTLDALHSGSVYTIVHYPQGYLTTLSYYGNSAIHQETADVFALGGGRTIKMPDGELALLAKLVYTPDLTNELFQGQLLGANGVVKDGVISMSDHSSAIYFTSEYSFH